MEKCNDPKWASEQLTKDEAIAFGESGIFLTWSYDEVVRFQLFQKRMCMPFDVFHKAIEEVLGRPVWTHEFANRENIVNEYLGEREAPTMEEIINLIPEDKRIIIGV